MRFRQNPRKPVVRALTPKAKEILALTGQAGGYYPQTSQEKSILSRLQESGLVVCRLKDNQPTYLITLQGRRLV